MVLQGNSLNVQMENITSLSKMNVLVTFYGNLRIRFSFTFIFIVSLFFHTIKIYYLCVPLCLYPSLYKYDRIFFFPSKRPRSVMAKCYLVDSYSVGVESGWGSQMVGVFDSPDGCSVWCSVTLGRLIDMLPPSPPSPRLLFLHLLLQHSHCYEDGYQPPGL